MKTQNQVTSVPDAGGAAGGPILIGGADRSGKTYMRLLLTGLPDFAISRRTNLWTQFYGRFGDLARPENLERCLAAMAGHKHIGPLLTRPEVVRQGLRQGAPTYGRLFDLVHREYAARLGKPRWGDQTETIERCAGAVFAELPRARIIHLVRDPRDRFEAGFTRRPRSRGNLGASTAKWLFSAALAVQNRRRFPDRYLVIRYETMVCHPEETLRRVCRFVEAAYDPAVLRMAHAPRFQMFDGANERGGDGPLSTAYVGRYRGRLTPFEIAFIQAEAGRYLAAFGYDPEPVALPAGRPFEFGRAWLRGMGQMAAWRLSQFYRQRGAHPAALFGLQPRPVWSADGGI